MSFIFGPRSIHEISTIDPILQKILYVAITQSPIDFGLPDHGGRRDVETQYQLFMANRSKCDGVKIRSAHQDGTAFDIYAYVNGKGTWDPRYMRILAGVILSTALSMGYVLKWGGDFDSDLNFDEGDSWDLGHFELLGEYR